ncbi:hypothetical protein GCM10010275_67450 [Streptomyces litmocidini]|nr:hypothetical protein GCM10010275_67450 [Streptomyces litmocidini]
MSGLLADPPRLPPVWPPTRGEADVGALTEACGAARPAVGRHLAELRLGGLVTTRKEGRRVVYAVPDGHPKRLVPAGARLPQRRGRPGSDRRRPSFSGGADTAARPTANGGPERRRDGIGGRAAAEARLRRRTARSPPRRR